MNYSLWLTLHSWTRWLVLIMLIIAIWRSFSGWKGNKRYLKTDNRLRYWTIMIVHIQWALGLTLYFISPIVKFFYSNFNEAIHIRDIRFFGLEHSLMMFIALSIITWGSWKAKRKKRDTEKFKTTAIWFSIGLFIIFFNIPWEFSPLIARPLFRFW